MNGRGAAVDPLDIAVFGVRTIPSTYSGYETFFTVLLPALADRGHTVTLYARRDAPVDGEPAHVASARRREFRGVRIRNLPAVPGKSTETVSHGLVAGAVVAAARPDVVLAANLANIPYLAGLRAVGIPSVFNTDGQEWLRGKWGRAARSYFHLMARGARLGSAHLVADSPEMERLYHDEFGATSTVIPYCWTGLTPSAEPPMADLGRFFFVAGRLNPENQLTPIVRAFVRSRCTARLVVAGAANYDSPVARELAGIAAEDPRVEFVGHVHDRSDFAWFQKHAVAYVHGHSVGGLNPSLVEAMGSGAQVLAYDTPFNRYGLGEAGHYFQDVDSDLVASLERLDGEPHEASAGVRSAARQRATRFFDPDKVVDEYEAVLARSAGHRTRRRRTRAHDTRSA